MICADLKIDGKHPWVRDLFARVAMIGENTSTHDFKMLVGKTSSGDVFDGNDEMTFRTSSTVTSEDFCHSSPV